MLDNAGRVPFYEYRRPDGTILEVMQKMTDPPLAEDPETGVPLERVFHPIAVHFKGSGFYNTDYGKQKRAGGGGGSDESSSSNNDGGGDSGGAKKKDDAPAKKAETPAPSKTASSD